MFLELPWTHWLVLLSVVISLSGSVAYIRDTLAGRTKPNRVSWFLWGTVPMLGVAAALSLGADPWATARIFIAGLIPLIIFFASFVNQQSYWALTRFDYFCGAIALAALALWWLADSPRLAILFFALADLFAALPTLIKAWKFPETETGFVFFMGSISVLITIPAIPVWNIENSAFQVYLLAVNILLALFVYRKLFRKPVPQGA
jgi:hypothetical protein